MFTKVFDSDKTRGGHQGARRAVALVITASIALLFGGCGFSDAATPRSGSTSVVGTAVVPRTEAPSSFPIGSENGAQPSGLAPPGIHALANYHLTYVNSFNGRGIPAGWDVFTGVPGGDPGGHFASNHIVVHRGVLQLETWKDPRFGYRWVTGGLCQCGHTLTYGAFFVRSKVSGPGPNQVELLWPATNTWPPEVDFNETGGPANSTTASLHWSAKNHLIRSKVKIDMTQWHTWGVVWTKNSILYVVDGRIWASVHSAAQVPHVKMRLDLEQRAMCDLHRQCPTVPVTMSVDWVAEYSPS